MKDEVLIGMQDNRNGNRFCKGMRGTLLAWFVLLAIIPMGVLGFISYSRAQKAMAQSAMAKLTAVTEIKQNILLTLLGRWQEEILFVSKLETLKSDMVDMAAGFKFLEAANLQKLYLDKPGLLDAQDGSAYSAVHREEHHFFMNYSKIQKYEDILLIDTEGNIFYTEKKQSDFGANLTRDEYKDTNLGKLYKDLLKAGNGDIRLADMAIYGKGVAFFMGTPIFRGDVCLGYLVFRLPSEYLNSRIGQREGMGNTGETYLVGSERRMRSDSFNDPEGRNVKMSLAGTIRENGVDTLAVKEALAGRTGVDIIDDYRDVEVLSAYAPVEIQGLKWAIVTETDFDEAMAPANALWRITFGLGIGMVLIALMLSMIASGRIVRPVAKLTEWSKEIAGGKLGIVEIEVPDNEIGVLNASFRKAVKSLQAAADTQKLNDWFKTGQSELDDRMRGEQELESLCGSVITYIAHYLGAQVGTFHVDNSEGVFRLKASYAYKTRKNLSHEFKSGEGLVGQAALERQSILLTRVPDDYITVSSGLGEKQPVNILVVPLVYDEIPLGVIEIGSFTTFSGEQRDFLEEAAERIAIALHSALARQKLKDSLERSQRLTEELEAQQEELRAANEELEEQTRALKESEEQLKSQQEELQVTNEELEEKTEMLDRQKQDIEKANQDLEDASETLRERAEELALASKYKSEFLANMSHELRTPLNSLLLLADTLSENKTGNLTEDQLESAKVIFESGDQLLTMINEILDLSKIEAGRMELHMEQAETRDLGIRIEGHFRHMAEKKGLKLAVLFADNVPDKIETDVQRVEQILRNLVSNAIKFTDKGRVEINFGRPDSETDLSRSGLEPAGALAVSVRDTGIGIPHNKQKIIFEAFQQVDGGTARRYGGTGLGLSISRELANLLGGEIQLSSNEGEGSTFTLILPERQEKKQRRDPKTDPDPKPGRPSSGPGRLSSRMQSKTETIPDDRESIRDGDQTILVIEDDPKFAWVLQKQCRERGFKSIVSLTGEEGVVLAEKHRPVAVMLDIRLPGMDGWEVLATLKGNPDLRHIPVHIISVEEATIEALNRGAVGYLNKPVNRKGLDRAFLRIQDMTHRKIKNLLVLEDDDTLRKNIVRLIGNGDVHTDEAVTGKEALKAIEDTGYDCIILDLGLPDMDGFEFLKILKDKSSGYVPPVVVYTGKELTREDELKLRDYTDSIIIKGVRSEERLLDEASLFLHRMVGKMPEKKRKMIIDLHDTDAMFRGKRILMVDDDMRNVFALSKILTEKGMEVIKAENGKRGLEVLEKDPCPDLILMDIMMPVMDGYQTIKEIRCMDKFRNLPIIALTAKAMASDREKCIEAGANDYLVKPVDIPRLLSMMRVWLYR